MLTHCGTETIYTERLTLRRFTYEDWEVMQKNWVSDPKVQGMYGEPVYETKEEIIGLLGKYIEAYENQDVYRWAIILKESNECIGQIAFFMVNSQNHFAEIEYCIGGQFQKRGLATEATLAIIDYGFKMMNLHKVQICHREGNIASERVIKKCGFRYEGTLRDFFFIDGHYKGRLYYSILKQESRDSAR